MSIASEITRIKDLRDNIRQDFVVADMATGSERLSDLAENMRNINDIAREKALASTGFVEIGKEDIVFNNATTSPVLTVSASSTYSSNYPPSNAINGNSSGTFANHWISVSTSAGGTQWWAADFKFYGKSALVNIKRLKITTDDEGGRISTIDVQKKNADGSYETFHTHNNTVNAYDIVVNLNDLSLPCYGIRIIQKLAVGGYVHVSEVDIYGEYLEI